ncbi:hypothetical protein [Daejeonella oryzae]|uniref:hypothetical protein n=1 Tax=Daejeonella oryzae TaxID=1122943 RepID=UPI0003F61EF2|nr:hypothetical protein [Daejeonella oryzae]
MKPVFFSFLVVLFIFQGCKQAAESSADESVSFKSIEQNFNNQWADSSYWDDGKAEVAHYDASREIYKKKRLFDYTFITVSEDFNKEFMVKTDDYSRKDLIRVMKINAFAEIQTDNYPYHFLSSIFVLRNDPLFLQKMTMGSQEWCGNSFKEFLNQANGFKLLYHSYWDGEGDGEKKIPANVLFEDQLIYTLRSLNFKNDLKFSARVLASQVSSKVGKLELYDADFRVSESDSSWKVTVQLDREKRNVYEFKKEYPNILLKKTSWDKQDLVLKKTSRYAYWQN